MFVDFQSFKKHPLIVAVSGGPDSMCLLHLLKEAGFENIIVAHLDHQIREQSSKDADLVKKTSKKYGYPFELKTLNVKKLAREMKGNMEALGRDQRYAFFRELKKKYKAKFIVTAHHADDQIETVLLNIVRGCGLDGLSGMKFLEDDLWRPLIVYSKSLIEEYCREKKLKFVRESTNQDLDYSRNFLRHKVIPPLKELNPNLLKTMQKNIQLWSAAGYFFEKESVRFLETIRFKKDRYDLKKFLELDEVIRTFVLRRIFEEVHGHKKNLTQEHLEQILKVLQTNVSGKKKEFGPGKVLLRQKTFFEILDR